MSNSIVAEKSGGAEFEPDRPSCFSRVTRRRRSTHCLNGEWRFHKGFIPATTPHLVDHSTWRTVDLPHDWSIEGPFAQENVVKATPVGKFMVTRDCSGLPLGEGWYRKVFALDRETFGDIGDAQVFLKIEGAFKHSRVWINGEFVGENRSGYMPKIYDVSRFMGANERVFNWPGTTYSITIHVNALEQEGHWHEGAGIYRDVTLVIAPSSHFDHYSPYVTFLGCENGKAKIKINAKMINAAGEKRNAVLKYRVFSPGGDQVLSWRKDVELPAGESIDSEDILVVDDPELWDLENPVLYELKSELEVPDADIIDEVETLFGLRSVEFLENGILLLNGEQIQIRGGCVHNDFAVIGTALPDAANAKTVMELKSMGCNIIRSAHHHASESLMRECDRLGMLFWAEYRGLLSLYEEVRYDSLKEAVRAARRHPSVILYCLANHGGDGNGELTKRLKIAHDIAKKEDPTRPTAIAIEGTSDHNANGFAMVTDLVGYNGGVRPGVDGWVDYGHEHYPERKIVISEFGSGRGARGVYRNVELSADCEKYYADDGRVFDQTGSYFSIFDLCRRVEEEWAAIAERDFLYGGIVWSAIDYWGETAGWPTVISQFGAALDICRFRKDSFYFFQQEWTDKPMLHLFPPWNHPGEEGNRMPVWVYGNCAEVELFLDGRSLGRKRTIPGSHLEWDVVYEPGALKAVGRTADGDVLEMSSVTPGPPARVVVEAEKPLEDDEYVFVTISIADADANPIWNADDNVTIETRGNLILKGICSGDPSGKETIGNISCRLFNGLALAVFQKRRDTPDKGKAIFKVDGLLDVEWSPDSRESVKWR